ncbi:uncharacterized protein [Elaeis guineensis]|uniref:Prostatic spermine-binding protein n=1 Tax=Elaeis guineensis var. tenera TaxID=51953 RepID=A0A6I9RP47_ELAGV|nr:prostatic spermine-binding protein [Elaeis guineensis]
MAEAEGDEQNLEPQHDPPALAKRKPVSDCVEEGEEEEEEERKTKLPKLDITAPLQDDDEDDDEDGEDDDYEEGADDDGEEGDPNGNAATDEGKGVVAAVDKGKGKMVVEEEDDEDSDDSRDDDSSGGRGDEGDDDSDFSDDPLAEVDLSNILPARTRRRAATQQGIRFVADRDGGDNDG